MGTNFDGTTLRNSVSVVLWAELPYHGRHARELAQIGLGYYILYKCWNFCSLDGIYFIKNPKLNWLKYKWRVGWIQIEKWYKLNYVHGYICTKDLQIPKMGKIYSRTYCRIPVTMFLIKLVLFNDPRGWKWLISKLSYGCRTK